MTVHKLRGDLQDWLDHIVGKKIIGCGVEEEEFVIVLEDHTNVVLFSEEDLSLYIELPKEIH